MSAALSWSPPVFSFVRLPDVVGFRSGLSEEVDPRLYVSGISSRDDARESSPHSLQHYRVRASIPVRVVQRGHAYCLWSVRSDPR